MAKDTVTYKYTQEPLDIMFVVDYSNSMNSNDRQKIGLQMIEAFMDEAFSKEMRVGFVAYNQEVLASYEPIALNEKNKRNILKSAIHQLTRSGSTDTGLALKIAKSLLADTSRQSMIVLISDGEPDLSYSQTGRTLEDSLNDMDGVAKECAQDKVPIYTIAFGQHFDGTSKCLEDLATQTHGKSYFAHEPGDLVEIFNTIIEKYTMSSVVPIVASLASGDLQTIEIPFENQYTAEANILLVSSSPIEEANVWYEGQETEMNQSEYYFTTKINNPQKGQLKLQYRAPKGAYMKLYLVLYSNLTFQVDIPQKIEKQSAFEIKGYFLTNDTKQIIKDINLYKRFKTNMTLLTSSETQEEIPMSQLEDKIVGQLTLHKTGEYGVNIVLKDTYYNIALNSINILCDNAAPIGECVIKKTYPNHLNQEILIDLSTYFEAVDGDALSYSITSVDGNSIQYEIKENILQIIPQNTGKTRFKVVATDSENAQAISPESTVTILPLWRYYIVVTMGVIIILSLVVVGGVIYYIQKRKKRPIPEFTGKLNVYFTKTPEDIEIPPLTFSLFQMKVKSITLDDLLQGAGYPIQGLEMEKVIFEPGFNREIVFYHNTQNSVMIGASIACRKLKYSVAYGTKFYITAPDESYDLEIHFVSARS